MGELGVAAQFGFRNMNNEWELDRETMYSLVKSSLLRQNLLAKSKELIDFQGAKRIVDAIRTL